MRRRRIVFIAVLTTALLAAAAWFWPGRHVSPETGMARAVMTALPKPDDAERPPSNSAIAATLPDAATDHGARFRASRDMLEFLKGIAPAAEAGDPDALYYVYRAIHRCTFDYVIYFGRGARERTLERALVLNAGAQLDEQTTRELYRDCAAFRKLAENPWTDWRAALEKAVAAGSPLAKATLASRLARDAHGTQDEQARAQLESRMLSLSREALASRDPEVLSLLANVAGRLPSQPADEQRAYTDAEDAMFTWMLAACQRGYDCGRGNEGFRNWCGMDPACQPFETVVDLVRRRAGARFDTLQLRATELNEKLDAGRFDEIEL